MTFKKYLIQIALLVVVLSFATAANRKQFTATDNHNFKRISTPAVSQDGRFVVYGVRNYNATSKKATNYLQLTQLNSNKTVQLTNPAQGQSDFNPVFSSKDPNVLFFLSSRSGSSQIWYLTLNTSQIDNTPAVQQLTNYSLDLSNLKGSASGDFLVFTTEVYTDCDNFDCTAARDLEIANRGSNTYFTYDKLMVRHWDRWLNDKVSHIFVQKLAFQRQGSQSLPTLASGPLDQMERMNTNSPVPVDGGSEQFDVSPINDQIAFTGNDRDRTEAYSTGWKIYVSNLTKTHEKVRHLTRHTKARTLQPRYSPSGKLLAYLAMDRPGYESDKQHIEIIDLNTHQITQLYDKNDNSIGDFSWLNSTHLLFTTIEVGYGVLYSIDIRNNKSQVYQFKHEILSATLPVQVGKTNKMIMQSGSFIHPDELFLIQIDNSTQRPIQVTQINDLSAFQMISPQIINYKGGYNDTVQGWVFKPANFDPTKKYPLAFLIHGGPESPWESVWSYRWNPQIWANAGYAVLMINPHGSPGQGQRFTDAVINDWGGVPYQDLMTGFEYMDNFYWIDKNRTCAVGASYGGYMVNYIQGQTDRFKCLVTHDGVFSTLTMFYATEEVWFPMAEYCPINKTGCTPWQKESRENFLKFSPESYVQNFKTPHLVIHGSNDFRIPISEGLSMFTALQIQNVPSRFLHMTEENHWVLKPENSIKWYDEVIGWLDKHTKETTTQTVQVNEISALQAEKTTQFLQN